MKLHLTSLFLVILTTTAASAQVTPAVDHHQHLFSPDIVKVLAPPPGWPTQLSANEVIPLLDAAGIKRGVVLSVAYLYGSPARTVENEYEKIKAENNWTAAQAGLYPKRLVAFCSFNPLKDYALTELERCAGHPGLKHGLKLHFGNADVQLQNPEHAEQLKKVFSAANRHRMAIAVHMRASISRGRPYGPEQARIFLDQLLAAAPDITVQVAHLAGTGPGYNDPSADSVMAVLAEAVERRDPRTRRLLFDVATCVDRAISPENAALVAKRIRQVGVKRILYGSDSAVGDNLRPRDSWAAFRKLPLTESEFKQIAKNVAPYLR